MPLRHTDKGWMWGSHGPFDTKAKALSVARAAHAHGFKEESTMEPNLIGEFVGTLLHSATVTHFMHLQAQGEGSDAAHRALGNYYEQIVDLTDAVAESIQGAYDQIIEPYPSAFTGVRLEPLAYIKALRDYVREARKSLPQDSEIQNEIDNIATLMNKTCYKLGFLR